MASKMDSTPRRKRKRLNMSREDCKNATPEKIELTVSQIREDMRELEDLRKKSSNISGSVSGQMKSAIQRVEESLVLLTAKANEAEKLKKRVEALQMENIELMARHCTYAVRAKPVSLENESENAGNAAPEADLGSRESGAGKPVRNADADREELKEESRKLREFVAEEIRGVKEDRGVVPATKKSYASCVKKDASKRVESDGMQTAGPSKPNAPGKRSAVRENGETRKKNPNIAPKNPNIAPIISIRVRGNSLPYAEMISKIKTDVNPADFNVSVFSLRKSPSGEAEFRVGGAPEDVNRFEEKIRVCVGHEGTLRKIQPMSFVHISDLEVDITEEVIMRDICKACKVDVVDIKVTSIRPAFGNTMKASVKMPRRAAETLRNAGRTVIGYVSCRCAIRDFVPRCFRCGETGHLAANCTGPDKTGMCFGCGCESHRILDCPKRIKQGVETLT